MKKKIAVFGSSGSIGLQTLDVVNEFPEKFEVVALAVHNSADLLIEQAKKYKPQVVVISNPEKEAYVNSRLQDLSIPVFTGNHGLTKVIKEFPIDIVVMAVTGIDGLLPTLVALQKKITVALANKETIVTAGQLVMETVNKYSSNLLPVDSEHSAIFQCWEAKHENSIEEIILTASGGSFLNNTIEEMGLIKPEMALKHPNWSMGAKITVDSSTLMNKGLEVIEAHHLFNMPYEKIKVVIHPQSTVHSMVQYGDGSILAHLGLPDMKTPIQFALSYPERWINSFPKLDIYSLAKLEFIEPDLVRFPSLRLAFEAGKIGGSMTTVLNAANEVAVDAFLHEKIGFLDIPQIVEKVMSTHSVVMNNSLEEILWNDQWARRIAQQIIANK